MNVGTDCFWNTTYNELQFSKFVAIPVARMLQKFGNGFLQKNSNAAKMSGTPFLRGINLPVKVVLKLFQALLHYANYFFGYP